MTDDTTAAPSLEDVLARFPEEQRDAVRSACIGGRWGLNENLVAYFGRLELQQIITASSFEDLPKTLVRKCCQYKSCGATDLALQVSHRYEHVEGDMYRRVGSSAVYARTSNDDVFWHASTIEEMLAKVNDPTWYPEQDDFDAPRSSVRRIGERAVRAHPLLRAH